MAAGLFGYMGYDMVRLMERLPDANPDRARHSGRGVHAADGHGDLRQHRGSRGDRHAGVAGAGPRRRAPRTISPASASPTWSPTSTAACRTAATGAAPATLPEPTSNVTPGALPRDGRARRRSTSAPATSSRWCPRSASPCPSTCRRSRSTARCAGSTRRRSCSSSTSTASRWSAPARRSWSGCATARWWSGRSPAPAGAAPRAPRTARWPRTCWPTPRSWPST